MHGMDIEQIEAFLAVAQAGGFTRAASRLHRSQPAISRRLGLLEHELGAPLFERLPGAVRLTDLGHAFLPHAEAMLAAIRDGREAVLEQLEPGAGSASLAVVGTVVNRGLADALRAFSERPGRPRLHVRTTTSEGVSHLVRRGEVTLGLRYEVDEHPELACRCIGREPMVVVAAADHVAPRAVRKGSRWGCERWIGFPPRASKEDFGRLLRRQLAKAGLRETEVMEVDSLSAQKRLVEAGFGIALLPRSGVADEIADGTLKVLRAPSIATRIPVCLVHRRHGYLSPASCALAEQLTTTWR